MEGCYSGSSILKDMRLSAMIHGKRFVSILIDMLGMDFILEGKTKIKVKKMLVKADNNFSIKIEISFVEHLGPNYKTGLRSLGSDFKLLRYRLFFILFRICLNIIARI
uniref:Uncharacterized protein n=1 Tax=Cacopsylla melanoneura TaxID=428564 RepID=A0A8D8WZ01_9HEMI